MMDHACKGGEIYPPVRGVGMMTVEQSKANRTAERNLTEVRRMLDWPLHPIGRGTARLDGN